MNAEPNWDFIDKVYCISLEHRADRRVEAQQQFDAVGLGHRVEFIINQKHPSNAEQGNFESQMNALRTGLTAGARTIMVFEDDVIFERVSAELISRLSQFVRAHRNWHAIFLGCFIKSAKATKFPSILNIRFQTTTHSYIATRSFAQNLVDTPWPGGCLDDLVCSLKDPQLYALTPMIAFQSDSQTDNDKQANIDRLRRRLGGIRRLQKINEFFIVHKNRLIVLHVLVLLLILGRLLLWRH